MDDPGFREMGMGIIWNFLKQHFEKGSTKKKIVGLPSGEQPHSNGKIHHAINGKIHYFDWAIFNSFLYVHQRVCMMMLEEKLVHVGD